MPEQTGNGQPNPSTLRIWGELAAVVLLSLLGMVLGALMPWLVLSPIFGMAVPLLAATYFLHRQGGGWRELGFARAMPLKRFVLLTLGAVAAIYLITGLVITPILRALGAPPVDIAILVDLIEGDRTMYLLFLIPVGWGSAAFGEELLLRGFVLNRFALLFGTSWAVVLQALLFSLGHAYQGITGVVSLFVVGLLLGIVYLRAGGNLWPVIVAHGIIDTISISLIYFGFGDATVG
jgi:uncharacterized protein